MRGSRSPGGDATRPGMLRQGGKSSSFVAGGRRSVHTTFDDGAELIEEYDLKTDELLGVSALTRGRCAIWTPAKQRIDARGSRPPLRCARTSTVRKRRTKTKLGGEGQWEYLVGDAPRRMNPNAGAIRESSSNVSAAAGSIDARDACRSSAAVSSERTNSA